MANTDMFTLLIKGKIDSSDVKKQLDVISEKTEVKLKVNVDTGKLDSLKTVTTKGTDSMGQLVNVTEKFNGEGKLLNSVVTKVDDSMKKANSAIEKTSESTRKAGLSLKSLGGDFVETTLKVFKFGLSTKIIGLFQSAITEAKDAIFEYDEALAEFKKVSDLSGESLKKFTEQAFNTASELSTSASNVIDATTEFKKSGFSEEDSQILAKQALIFKDIADEEISASDSAKTLIQVTKAYNMTAQDGEHIINAL